MNTFDKFLELHRVEARQPIEVGQGFLWYHCRVSGEKSADAQTVLQYFKVAGIVPPLVQDLDQGFRSGKNGVTAFGDQFRVAQDSAGWFSEKYEVPVFKAGLPIFVAKRLWFGRHVCRTLAVPLEGSIGVQKRTNGDRLLFWAKEHPLAAWLGLLASVLGIALAVWPMLK